MKVPADHKKSFKMQAEDILVERGIDLDAYSSALDLEEARYLAEDMAEMAERAFLAGVEWAKKNTAPIGR